MSGHLAGLGDPLRRGSQRALQQALHLGQVGLLHGPAHLVGQVQLGRPPSAMAVPVEERADLAAQQAR
eukprot:77324-Pyramimonas_sp.AAC.1